ncbi:UNVERIFIED_CONTAM: hypothetical protein HDU68_000927 [Siphonaria sp. JEL0065]|nr:hypothetical protein HDU68_000927 [Siphonaria sp. JEL0065]
MLNSTDTVLQTLQELRDAKPITDQQLASTPNAPVEPLWWNIPASRSIRRYLVTIPVLLAIILAFSLYTSSAIGMSLNAGTYFSILDVVVIGGFNVLGYMAVERRIPEWMALFTYYYVIWGTIKIIWTVLIYTVLYKSIFQSQVDALTKDVSSKTGMKVDVNAVVQDSFESTKYSSMAISIIVTIAYTVWIVWRAFIPYREYALQCREALKGAGVA